VAVGAASTLLMSLAVWLPEAGLLERLALFFLAVSGLVLVHRDEAKGGRD